MTCGYCRDCKWWNANLSDHEAFKGLGLCGIVYPVGELQEPERAEYRAFGSGYDDSGSLLTRPDFGCVQFEAKEEKTHE